jgi:hypothetical protein
MGPRAVLDAMEKRKFLLLPRIIQPLARHYTTELTQLHTIAGNE